jgi:hypothetical protein
MYSLERKKVVWNNTDILQNVEWQEITGTISSKYQPNIQQFNL